MKPTTENSRTIKERLGIKKNAIKKSVKSVYRKCVNAYKKCNKAFDKFIENPQKNKEKQPDPIIPYNENYKLNHYDDNNFYKYHPDLDPQVEIVPYIPDIFHLDYIYNMHSMANIVEYQRLKRYSREFIDIACNFPYCMYIESIDSIHNPFIQHSFELKRKFQYNNQLPLRLFHGTKFKYLHSICKNNFNWRLSGIERGHRIGHGVNFTDKLMHALNFCDNDRSYKCIIVADVLVDKTVRGKPNMYVPPEHCDTAISKNKRAFVKFGDSEYCPRYVVYFRVFD